MSYTATRILSKKVADQHSATLERVLEVIVKHAPIEALSMEHRAPSEKEMAHTIVRRGEVTLATVVTTLEHGQVVTRLLPIERPSLLRRLARVLAVWLQKALARIAPRRGGPGGALPPGV